MYDDPAAWIGWAWWISGWGLVAVSSVVLLWALFWDRARGRLRCPACWYDMRGGGLTCPECGHGAGSERALVRTRRRHWIAAGALVPTLAGFQVAQWPEREWEDGWTRYVPTTVLVLLADRGGESLVGSAAGGALMSRRMWSWQAALVEWRMLALDAEGRAGMVTTRSVWPVGERVMFEANLGIGILPHFEAGWLELESQGRTTRVELGPDGECGCCCGGDDEVDQPEDPDEDRLVLPAQAPGKHVDRVRVRLKSRGWTIAAWTAEVEYEVAGTIDDVVKPLSNEAVDAAARRSLRIEEYEAGDGTLYALWLSAEDAGLGEEELGEAWLQGEVLVEGKVVAHFGPEECFRVVWDDSDERGANVARAPAPSDGGEAEARDPEARAAYAREHVRLRITGNQRQTLRDFEAAAYWSGTVEIGLGELMAEQAR